MEGRCIKCGRSNHQALEYKAPSRAKTPSLLSNANKEPVQKKMKFDKVYLKITELGSEKNAGME